MAGWRATYPIPRGLAPRNLSPMRMRLLGILGALLLIGGSVATAVLVKGAERHVVQPDIPGTPYIDVLSPRDGSKPKVNAVVVKVKVHNFKLAPAQFGKAPQLGEGMLRFSLNKVPDSIDQSQADAAASNPLSSGRVIGRSFDFPKFAGPNGILAARFDSQGQYSPATEPQIYYRNLPKGLFRLIITLSQNDGTPTPYHAVTHFRIE
jgi:hypothetical protein